MPSNSPFWVKLIMIGIFMFWIISAPVAYFIVKLSTSFVTNTFPKQLLAYLVFNYKLLELIISLWNRPQHVELIRTSNQITLNHYVFTTARLVSLYSKMLILIVYLSVKGIPLNVRFKYTFLFIYFLWLTVQTFVSFRLRRWFFLLRKVF